jgi:hypothetical protein
MSSSESEVDPMNGPNDTADEQSSTTDLKCGPDSEYVEVPYNVAYGGFAFSHQFTEEYHRRCKATGVKPKEHIIYSRYGAEGRTDPLVLEILREKGCAWSSDAYCSMYLYPVPKQYIKYVEISDYDGQESIGLNREKIYSELIEAFLVQSEEDASLTLQDLKTEIAKYKETMARYDNFLKNYPY